MRRVVTIPAVPPAPTEGALTEIEAPAAQAPAPSPPPFQSEATVVAEVLSPKPGEAKGHDESIDAAWIGKRVEYALVYVNRKGRESPLSEIVRIDPMAALAPPGPPKAEARDGFVALSWSLPPEAPAYPGAPLNPEPLSTPSFEDESAVFGVASCYVVSAVLPPPSQVESLPSEEACITPEDRFPPPAPSGLVAVPSGEAILLSWTEVEAPDRKGYRVYRGASPAGPFELVAEVTGTSYTDGSAASGETFFYSVTAIDDAPGINESARSEAVEARRSP